MSSSSSSSEEGTAAAARHSSTTADTTGDMVVDSGGQHSPTPPHKYTLKQAFYKAYSTRPPKHENDMLLTNIPREDKSKVCEYYEYTNNPSAHWGNTTHNTTHSKWLCLKSTQQKHGMPLLTFLRIITSCQSDTQKICRTCYRNSDNV